MSIAEIKIGLKVKKMSAIDFMFLFTNVSHLFENVQ